MCFASRTAPQPRGCPLEGLGPMAIVTPGTDWTGYGATGGLQQQPNGGTPTLQASGGPFGPATAEQRACRDAFSWAMRRWAEGLPASWTNAYLTHRNWSRNKISRGNRHVHYAWDFYWLTSPQGQALVTINRLYEDGGALYIRLTYPRGFYFTVKHRVWCSPPNDQQLPSAAWHTDAVLDFEPPAPPSPQIFNETADYPLLFTATPTPGRWCRLAVGSITYNVPAPKPPSLKQNSQYRKAAAWRQIAAGP